jgi:hydrogenase maturation protease
MTTVVVGMGNPVLADDAVGLVIARRLRERLGARADVEVIELCAGGLRLVEAIAGYERAVIVDAMVSGGRAGRVWRLRPEDLPRTRTAHSSHEGSLGAAWELGGLAGLRLPGDVRIWAVEAGDCDSFAERLTPAVERAAARVVEEIWGTL